MTLIVGISGSLRRASFNSGLLRAAEGLAPEGTRIVLASIADIPLYNGDREAEDGIPAVAAALKDAIAEADGVLIATPEYNNSIPGVMKNAIDWASRPPSDSQRVFGGKRVAVIGASPGRLGTVLAQNAWLSVLHTLGAEYWSGGRLMVSDASRLFDANGTLTDEATRERLKIFVEGFAAALR